MPWNRRNVRFWRAGNCKGSPDSFPSRESFREQSAGGRTVCSRATVLTRLFHCHRRFGGIHPSRLDDDSPASRCRSASRVSADQGKHPWNSDSGRSIRDARAGNRGRGLAISTFALRSIRVTDSFGRASTGRDQVTTSRQPALGGSVATPLPVSPNVEIVPAFGFRWLKRSEDGLGAHIGAGSYAYHFGANVRFKL